MNEDEKILARRVALLDTIIINDNDILKFDDDDGDGISIQCFPVYHGGTYISLGFNINNIFIYISDVKIIPIETMIYLKGLTSIEVLVIDALDKHGMYSHCSLYEAIDIAKELKPKVVYFTGMSCGIGDHDDVEKELIEMGLDNYHLAYDGLVISF